MNLRDLSEHAAELLRSEWPETAKALEAQADETWHLWRPITRGMSPGQLFFLAWSVGATMAARDDELLQRMRRIEQFLQDHLR